MITNETCSTVLIRAHIKRCITPIVFILKRIRYDENAKEFLSQQAYSKHTAELV